MKRSSLTCYDIDFINIGRSFLPKFFLVVVVLNRFGIPNLWLEKVVTGIYFYSSCISSLPKKSRTHRQVVVVVVETLERERERLGAAVIVDPPKLCVCVSNPLINLAPVVPDRVNQSTCSNNACSWAMLAWTRSMKEEATSANLSSGVEGLPRYPTAKSYSRFGIQSTQPDT